MSTSNSVDAIEVFYNKYQKEIFDELIWPHLFDDDVKYEDKDIFEKTEEHLCSFFTSQGFEWNYENKEKVHLLVLNSNLAKWISVHFQKKYEQCLVTELKWTPDSSVQCMVNQLIDASIQNKTELSYYYAKRLLVKYYYDKFITVADNEKVIGNIMIIFFTNNDVQRLAQRTLLSLDALINEAYYGLNEVLSKKEKKIDSKIFIRKFVMLKSFHVCLRYNPELKEQISNCKYVAVYRDLLEKIEVGVNNTPVKEIQCKQVSRKISDDDRPKTDARIEKSEDTKKEVKVEVQPEKREQPKTEEKASVTFQTRTRNNPNRKIESNDPIDVFLKKIGGRNTSKTDPVVELLCASEEIILDLENHSVMYETLGGIYFNEDLTDVEIEELRY